MLFALTVLLGLLAVLSLVETVLYLRITPWYYTLGPPLRSEHWHCPSTDDQVRAAIRPLLRHRGLAGRESSAGFGLRQSARALSVWPRVFLRVEPLSPGVRLTYQIRPFCSMAAFGLTFLCWGLMMARGLGWLTAVIAYSALIIGLYAVWQRRDIRKLNRLRPIRAALLPLGLRICERCGYDLFAQPIERACPECGARDASQ